MGQSAGLSAARTASAALPGKDGRFGTELPRDIQRISLANIAHYDRHADKYRRFTRDHAILKNHAAFQRALPDRHPCQILDFGCGTGRDLLRFRSGGHHAVGLDGSRTCAQIATALSGCPVWIQDFLDLHLPERHFHGVFANAALFHVPSAVLPGVLYRLSRTLKSGGVLFASNPIGGDEEGWAGDRYVCLYSARTWRRTVRDVGFVAIEHFYRPPGLPRRRQTWLATLWRKPR